MNQDFEIKGDYIELIKLLKASSLCETGGQAKIVIQAGAVTVDGENETRKGRKIRNGMIVKYGDQCIKVISKEM